MSDFDYRSVVREGALTAPLGTVLPYDPDAVPESWLIWNGQKVPRSEFPDLVTLLERTREYTERLWTHLGGHRINADEWRTPDLDRSAAWGAIGMPDMGTEIVLAQKARSNSDIEED